jgi:hypothetical protein
LPGGAAPPGTLATRRQGWLLAGLLLAGLLLNLRQPVLCDDAYITFRVARNFAEGHGLCFNPGERVLSTTAPGLALALAGFHLAGGDIVWGARALSFAGLALAVLCLVALGRRAGQAEAGFAAALLLCVFPDLIWIWGNECALLLGLACLTLWLADAGRPAACALVAVTGSMVRPDFTLLALTVGVVWLVRNRRHFLIYATIGGLMGLGWLFVMEQTAGTLLPHTLAAKARQGEWIAQMDPRANAMVLYLGGFRWLMRRLVFDRPLGFFTLFGAWILVTDLAPLNKTAASTAAPRTGWLWLTACWSLLHLAAYALIGVPGSYVWYYYPLWLFVCATAGLGLCRAVEMVAPPHVTALNAAQTPPASPGGLRLGLFVCLTLFLAINLQGLVRDENSQRKLAAYRQMGELVRRDVAPGQSVMLSEIGIIGYYGGCHVIDTFGLIHDLPDNAVFGDRNAVAARFAPDYIVGEGWLDLPGMESYQAEVLAGIHALLIPRPDADPLEYRQVGRVHVPPDYMPVLLKRQ